MAKQNNSLLNDIGSLFDPSVTEPDPSKIMAKQNNSLLNDVGSLFDPSAVAPNASPFLEKARPLFNLSDEEILEGEKQVKSTKPDAADDEVLKHMVDFAKQADPRVLKQQPQQGQEYSDLFQLADERARKRQKGAMLGDIMSGVGEIFMGRPEKSDEALSEREKTTKREERERETYKQNKMDANQAKDPNSLISQQFQKLIGSTLGIDTDAPASLLSETFPHLSRIVMQEMSGQQKQQENKQKQQEKIIEKQDKSKERSQDKTFTAVTNFNRDPIVRKAQDSITAIGKILTTIAAGNPIGDQALLPLFTKAAGDVGNMAEKEQMRYSGSPALLEKLKRLASMITTGRQSEENIRYSRELAAEWGKFSNAMAKTIAKNRAKQVYDLVGESEEVLTNRFYNAFGNVYQQEENKTPQKTDVKKLSDKDLDAEIARLKTKQGVK